MSTIADLMVKIGADSSGLNTELTKSQQAINQTFSTNPIDNFANSVEGSTKKLDSFIWNLKTITAVAAGGFGLEKLVDEAVDAGDALYNLTKQYGISTNEAIELSHVMAITGTSSETAAKAVMRLDKSLSENSTEGKRAQATLQACGVSITDANGRLLPLNQQLEQLSIGYNKALKSGQGQAFLMNTLGARGLALQKTLMDYREAAEAAAKVKPITLDPEEMHQIDLELKTMKLQAEQVGIGVSAAFAPVVMEILPKILPYLQEGAAWLDKNKQEVAGLSIEFVKLLAYYKAFKLLQSGINIAKGVAGTVGAMMSPTQPDKPELTKTQNRQINSAIKDSDKTYAKMRKDAIATAKQQNLSAEETQTFLSQKFAEIGVAASTAAEKIRANMTTAFIAVNAAAEENAAVIDGSLTQTGVAAQTSAGLHAVANTEKIVSNEGVITSNAAVSESTTLTGEAAENSAVLQVGANKEKIASNEGVISSNALVGESAEVEGAETVTANIAAMGGINNTKNSAKELGVEHELTGNKAVEAGVKSEQAVSRLPSAISKVTTALSLMAGGWMGVAAAALYAAYCAYQYFHAKEKEIENKTYVLDGTTYLEKNGQFYKQPTNNVPNANESVVEDPTGSGVSAAGDDSETLETDPDQNAGLQNLWWARHKNDPDYQKELAEQKIKDAEAAAGNIDVGDLGNLGTGSGKSTHEKTPKAGTDSSTWSDAYRLAVEIARRGVDPMTSYVLGGIAPSESGGANGTLENLDVSDTPGDGGSEGAFQWRLDRLDHLRNTEGSTAFTLAGNADFTAQELLNPDASAGGYEHYHSYANILSGLQAMGSNIDMDTAYNLVEDNYIRSGRNSNPEDAQRRYGNFVNWTQTHSYTDFLADVNKSDKTESGIDKQLEKHRQEIMQANKDLKTTTNELEQTVATDTGTAYEAGIAKVFASVKKYQDTLDKIKNVDSSIDISKPQKLLDQYKISEIDKVTQQWRQSWMKLKDDLAKIYAGIHGNYEDLAVADYNLAVFELDKERKERIKAVQQTKDDVQAKLAIDNWYAASLSALQKKEKDAQMESYGKNVNAAIDNDDFSRLQELMKDTDSYNTTKQWAANKTALKEYYDLWDKSNLNMTAQMASVAQSFDNGLEGVFTGLGSNINSVDDLLQSFGNLILTTIEKIVAEMAAARVTESIFGKYLTGGTSSSVLGTVLNGVAPYAIGGIRSSGSNSLSGLGSILDSIGISVPAFANGGVITAPTLSMVGEGKDKEAILPLNTNTLSGIANGISKNMNSRGSAPQVNITNNSGADVKVDSVTQDEYGEYQFNINIDKILTNHGGSLSALKAAMGVK
ncbi:hypothetical protein [Megasphaera sueciensis]|uniref:hypothetical protein n=1 Tax=Megasphaera sueciensis TaxID=349094 RepID=UPI003D04395A